MCQPLLKAKITLLRAQLRELQKTLWSIFRTEKDKQKMEEIKATIETLEKKKYNIPTFIF